MKKLLFIFFLLIEIKLMAQDPVSSQFYFNQLYMNPAFAGINMGARLGATYRNQWTAIPSKFETYNAWADIYNPYFNGGLGFIALQDVSGEGALKTTSIGILQSYERAIPKIVRIRAGFNVTVTNKHIDWSKLVFSDQLDGVQGNIYPTSVTTGSSDGKTFADFTAGTILDAPMIKTDKTIITNTIGYAVNHLTQPNEALSGAEGKILPRKHTVHYTMVIELMKDKMDKKPLYVSPNVIYEQQANFATTNLGFYMMRRPLIAGFFYRKRKLGSFKDNDSFILFLGLNQDLNKTTSFRLGYSYDFTINKLGSNTMGSHEISLALEFKDKRLFNKNAKAKKKSKKATECEDFGARSILF